MPLPAASTCMDSPYNAVGTGADTEIPSPVRPITAGATLDRILHMTFTPFTRSTGMARGVNAPHAPRTSLLVRQVWRPHSLVREENLDERSQGEHCT